MWWVFVMQLAMWEHVTPPVLHAGSWQSCVQEDGTYAERVLEHFYQGKVRWVLHLGPKDEFALYTPETDPYGPDHSHDTADNLLGQAYRISDVETWRGKRQWTVPKLHLWLSIVRAGGSRDECQSFYIRIEEKK